MCDLLDNCLACNPYSFSFYDFGVISTGGTHYDRQNVLPHFWHRICPTASLSRGPDDNFYPHELWLRLAINRRIRPASRTGWAVTANLVILGIFRMDSALTSTALPSSASCTAHCPSYRYFFLHLPGYVLRHRRLQGLSTSRNLYKLDSTLPSSLSSWPVLS